MGEKGDMVNSIFFKLKLSITFTIIYMFKGEKGDKGEKGSLGLPVTLYIKFSFL